MFHATFTWNIKLTFNESLIINTVKGRTKVKASGYITMSSRNTVVQTLCHCLDGWLSSATRVVGKVSVFKYNDKDGNLSKQKTLLTASRVFEG